MSRVHFLLLVFFIPATIASPRNLRLSPADIAVPDAAAADTPITYFEVDRPLRPPPGSSGPCSTLLLSHSFGFTYTKPPVTAAYSPPDCLAAAGGGASAISLAVLEWRATCRGVQFDRIFGIWLNGVELLRSCTAEPRPNGIVWSVSKDVTKYASLLAAGNSTLAVYLGNLVNDQYTGVYHANITLHLYFSTTPASQPVPATAPADIIVPISRSLPLNDGLWFQIQNATDVESASVTLPSNTYRAVLEVYVSFHGDDEFWYTHTPDGNGPFREVTVLVDGDLVGAVWPFPVIFTGGINPLLWRPITGIGSFNLPTYDIELTPFLAKMLDGKAHELGFAVTNAVDVWYVDGNLHLWLDPMSTATTASLVSYDAPRLAVNTSHTTSMTSQLDGPNEQYYYHTTASRRISAAGWVESSSHGRITTNATQTFAFENTYTFSGDGTAETVNQTTVADAAVSATDLAGAVLYSQQAHHNFPLYVDIEAKQRQTSPHAADVTYTVAREYHETAIAAGRWLSGTPPRRSLRNTQSGAVDVEMRDGNAVSATWGTRQTYSREATDGCYFRNVTSSGYSVAFDESDEVCSESEEYPAGGAVIGALPAAAVRASAGELVRK
uniref:Peptide N-acetyl-beta-D-glucosaminyl asparaginase amidase A N-terminal domain-containing protein n=1 Tax=Oryza punctata TaxID=4537 RepID=A0A0E0JFE9_ORYPU